MKHPFLLALLGTLLLAACTTMSPSAPGAPGAPAIFEVDPLAGWKAPAGSVAPPAWDRAMRDLAAGRGERAEQRLAELDAHAPGYPPATLALGVIALERGDLATAARRLEAAARTQPGWTAAEYYLARVETERGDLDAAASRLRALASKPGAPPLVAERLAALETRLFDRLFQAASAGPPSTAIASLRRALAIRPDSRAARILLVQNLISMRNFAEARMEIDPLLQSADATSPEVQQALAEIDAGRGRFEEAIERYERIVRADARPEYVARLEAIKQEFAIANMPPRYRAAAASTQLTRAELATLVYWTVSGVRFGRPPAEPAVAVDVADVEARDEIVRAIAFGLFSVDPVTRRVNPDRVVTSANAARVLLRVMALTAAPSCLSSSGADGSTHAGALAILDACGIDTAALRVHAEAPVSGAWALPALRKIDAMRAR